MQGELTTAVVDIYNLLISFMANANQVSLDRVFGRQSDLTAEELEL